MTGIPASVSVLALAGGLICLGVLTVSAKAHAQPASSQTAATRLQFDIPAQALGDALDEYSRLTGVAVLIDDAYARRQSGAVRGSRTAADALRQLLAGTGLAARYPGAQSIVIYGPPDAASPAIAPSVEIVAASDIPGARMRNTDYGPYVGRVQSALRRVLCSSAATRPGAYRLALQLRLNVQGTVERVRLLDTTGEDTRDAAISRAVQALDVGASPPAGMPQPISILLLPEGPQSQADCASLARVGH